MREARLNEILSRRGGGKAIAEACGVSHAAVSQWKKVPQKHVAAFNRVVADMAQRSSPMRSISIGKEGAI